MVALPNNLFDLVWDKGQLIPGMDPDMFRKDEWGTTIRRIDFNNSASVYGWCAHYVIPPWEGGNKEVNNLQPVGLLNEIQSLSNYITPWKDDSELWD
jgi:hypothetical protein